MNTVSTLMDCAGSSVSTFTQYAAGRPSGGHLAAMKTVRKAPGWTTEGEEETVSEVGQQTSSDWIWTLRSETFVARKMMLTFSVPSLTGTVCEVVSHDNDASCRLEQLEMNRKQAKGRIRK